LFNFLSFLGFLGISSLSSFLFHVQISMTRVFPIHIIQQLPSTRRYGDHLLHHHAHIIYDDTVNWKAKSRRLGSYSEYLTRKLSILFQETQYCREMSTWTWYFFLRWFSGLYSAATPLQVPSMDYGFNAQRRYLRILRSDSESDRFSDRDRLFNAGRVREDVDKRIATKTSLTASQHTYHRQRSKTSILPLCSK
jgi:hypothetical protein